MSYFKDLSYWYDCTISKIRFSILSNDILSAQEQISKLFFFSDKELENNERFQKSLNIIMNCFGADRVYRFKVDGNEGVQSCTHEVASKPEFCEIEKLQNIPLSINKHWHQEFLKGNIICINNVNALRNSEEKEVLTKQHIKSLLAIPCFINNELDGFFGVDFINKYHKFVDVEVKWFTSMCNFIATSQTNIIDRETTVITLQKYEEIDHALRTICGYAKIGILKFNLKNRTPKFYHEQWFENLGVTKNDLAIEDMYKHATPDYLEMIMAQQLSQTKMIESGELSDMSEENIIKLNIGGKIRWLQVKFLSEVNHAEDGGMVVFGANMDITDLVESRNKAAESDSMKSAFLANMSHEIRTPLNAIVGFADLIADTDTQEERQEYSQIISTNSSLLVSLINDILDLSKIEAGKINISRTEFDLTTLFWELKGTFTPKIIGDVEFRTEIPPHSCMVYLDRKRILQIMTNFMTNAIKFTKSGHIKMGYEIMGKSVKIYVEDTGCGIKEQDRNAVFSRFEKVNTFAQGTGLGMPICKAIIETRKGSHIDFESEVGKGSTFWAFINDCIIT